MNIEPSFVEYVGHYGTDDTVVDVARVSFSKRASEYTPEKNEKLIGYLARHNHWSPFAHPSVSLRIRANIAVARQLVKHQIGLTWNEESRRYIQTDPTFDIPQVWRSKPEGSVKQGSGSPVDGELSQTMTSKLTALCKLAFNNYREAIQSGIAPEMARLFLPLASNTNWIWTGSLYAWSRVCNQRLDPHAQYETRMVAEDIQRIVQPLFPVSWRYLRNVGPEE